MYFVHETRLILHEVEHDRTTSTSLGIFSVFHHKIHNPMCWQYPSLRLKIGTEHDDLTMEDRISEEDSLITSAAI